MWTRTFFACIILWSWCSSTLHCEDLSAPENSFTLSGVLQTDWYHIHDFSAKSQHRRFTGQPENEFTVQLDLIFDFKTDRSWSLAQLEFENPAGIQRLNRKKHVQSNKNRLAGSGEGDNLYLVKAFAGYALCDTSSCKLDFELGRHYFSDLFESKIQFDNQFDGMLLRYKKNNLECTVGTFVIDDRTNEYGYAGQVDLLNAGDSPLDFTYSLITWDRKSHFVNSQILAACNLPKKTTAYAAFLYNHAAKKSWRTNNTKAAKGWYAGLTIGKVEKKKDWSFDINYQLVQAQSVPEWDIAGIGAYNPAGLSPYSYSYGGFSNYKGYAATFLYGVTDHLNIQVLYQKARPANKHINLMFRASSFEITAIYSF